MSFNSADIINFVLRVSIVCLAVYVLKHLIVARLLSTQIIKKSKIITKFIKKVFNRIIYLSFVLFISYEVVDFFYKSSKIPGWLNKIFAVISGILFIYVIQSFIHLVLKIYTEKHSQDSEESSNTLNLLRLIINIFIWAVGLLLIISNLGYNINSLVTGLGIGGIAVALAVQNILGDVLNSFSIMFDKPFSVGDFIVVGEERGVVEYIGIKTTRIRSLSGEQVIIPNTNLVQSRVKNFKRMERRRVQIRLGLVYQTSLAKLKKAKQIILEILNSMEQITPDRVHFDSISAYSLDFEIIYYIESKDFVEHQDKKEELLFRIKEQFEKEGLEFAYPTQSLLIEK